MKCYLIGKVRGVKWEAVKGESRIKFVSSDGDQHSEHMWGGGFYNIEDCQSELAHHVSNEALQMIQSCGLALAILDRADSFGSIAEIAWASAHNIPVYIIIIENKTHTCTCIRDPECPVNHHDESVDSDWAPSGIQTKMHDAYWFVSCFPLVQPVVEVENVYQARSEVKRIAMACVAGSGNS